MSTPHYVVKHIGNRFVPVRQDTHEKLTRAACLGGAGLLIYLGAQRPNPLRAVLCLTGLSLAIRGACGCDWMAVLRDSAGRARDGRRSEAPSYQNDVARRASQLAADKIDEQVMESFPASDPPAQSGGAHA